MNLLDKYVAEVGKHLSRKGRADIEAEIRSTLEDMLEERNQASPDAEREAAVVVLLKEYGDPRKVAESYVMPRYLISPRIYPFFVFVTKIVMAALLGVGLLTFFLSGSIGEAGTILKIFVSFGQHLAGFLDGMISAFGIIVIVFVILEHVLPPSEFDTDGKDAWDPAELAKEADPDALKTSEPITTIIFTTIGLVVFNLYPDLVSLRLVVEGERVAVPILSNAFFGYLPWINLLGLLQIAFSLYLLRQGIWTIFSRISSIVLDIALIVLAYIMLKGPSLVNVSEENYAGSQIVEFSDGLLRILNYVPNMILFILIVVTASEVSQVFYRLFKKKPMEQDPVLK